MPEQEPPHFFFDERFATVQVVQAELERRGYYLHPVPREHTEGRVVGPLLHRLHTQIKKRGFGSVAGHLAITFSGFSQDDREVYAIPEARAWWRELDRQLPELPALLAILPELRYNGPGMQLTLLGDVDTVIHYPTLGGYDVRVANGPALIEDALRRIRQAGRTYHLSATAVANLIDQFRRGAHHER